MHAFSFVRFWVNDGSDFVITVEIIITITENGRIPYAMITTMKKLKSGYINGTRVTLGTLNDFLSTSSIANLSFLGCHEEGLPDSEYIQRSKECFSKKKYICRIKSTGASIFRRTSYEIIVY